MLARRREAALEKEIPGCRSTASGRGVPRPRSNACGVVVKTSAGLPAVSEGKEPYEIVDAPAFAGVPYPQPPAKEVETLAAARRHWRLIFGLGVVAGLAAYLICQTFTPLYASKATVMIDPREPKQPAMSADPTSAQSPSEETVRKNQIALIRSRQLAERVVSDLQLDRYPEFNLALRPPPPLSNAVVEGKRLLSRFTEAIGLMHGTPVKPAEATADGMLDKAVDLFLDRLATTSTDASRVIDIRFLSEDPERAARVANAVAEQYMQYKVKQDYEDAQSAIRALRGEIEALNVKIHDAERAIAKMWSEHGYLPASDLKIVTEQMTEFNKELVTASGQRAAAQGRLAELETARASNRLGSVASVLDSRLIQRLDEQAAQQSANIAEMLTLYGAEYPKLVQARAQLTDLRAQINAEIEKIAATYRSDLAVAQTKETTLRKLIEAAKADMAKATASDVDVRSFEREAEADRRLMELLAARLNDTEAQINRKGPEVRLLSRAIVPKSPSFPPKLAITAVAFLFAITGGTILAVLLERRDQSIRSTAQLRQVTTARVLGAVPAVRGAGPLRRSPMALVLAEPTSLFTENLRAVWFQIDHSMQPHAKTLVITSAVSREGKTSIAVSLARMLALGGRRVVIVDADLRRPSVHRALGLKQSPGLADLLEGSLPVDDVLQEELAVRRFPRRGRRGGLLARRLSAILQDTRNSADTVYRVRRRDHRYAPGTGGA